MTGGPKTCSACGRRPVASSNNPRTRYCYECMPGGPYVPPPCRRCGRTEGYYSAGLCDRCHRHAPQPMTSCRDCHAWGVNRLNQWLCTACHKWRKRYPVGTCGSCRTVLAVNDDQACRLCWHQYRATGLKKAGMGLTAANLSGQQLFFANLRHSAAGQQRGYRRPGTDPAPNAREGAAPFTSVSYRQLVLFDSERDLRRGRTHGFPPTTHPEMAAFLDSTALELASRHGWGEDTAGKVRRGLAIVLALQDTPGAPVRTTEVLRLQQLGLNCTRVLEVCQVAGLLDDDLSPVIDRWFAGTIADLPAQMRSELGRWYSVMKSGSKTPPRSKPRSETTIRLYISWSLPALGTWAAAGHTSLREITADDVRAVLPPAGDPRATMGQGLRCIFRVLKAHHLVFLNPLNRIRTGTAARLHPLPLPPEMLREALESTDPARAAVTALAAFYGLRTGQLRSLLLTDLHSGCLHLGERTIPLAAPVRARINAWIAYRERRWPNTANQHLFISRHTALGDGPVGYEWITQSIGTTVQKVREDRILHEMIASGGDLRRICDMFGLTIGGAERYAAALGLPGLARG
ncbi:hypothetical protein [Sinomonas atrocyanea]